MAIDPNIALGVRGVEVPNQLAQYGQLQQIMAARDTQQMNALKMQEAQAALEERNALRRLDPTAIDYESQLFKVNPQLGISFRKEQSAATASKAATSASLASAAKSKQEILGQALRDISSRPSDANIMAHTEDIQASPLFSEVEKQKALATQQTLLAMPIAERGTYLASQGAKPSDLKPTVQSVNQYGQTQLLNVPAFGGTPTNIGTYSDVPLPPPVEAQKARLAKAGASNINVSTEKKFGEQFASKLADTDIAKLTTAEKAPQLADSANRIIDLVNQGNVFTGPAAEVKMNIARVLNVAGASNDEKIANTEALIAATGQSTLDAIKGAGLGTGQGFTNKDLTFLQGIAGGTIGLTAKTLTDLATLQHRVAVRSADAWNKRSGEIPKEVVQGTGLSTAPIKVPELSAVGPIAIFAVNPQTGARIQSTDGGNTWKPAGAK
jgi:hypothetical protein